MPFAPNPTAIVNSEVYKWYMNSETGKLRAEAAKGGLMIAERLKAARSAGGLSQERVGRSIGVSKMTISKYETGSVVPNSARLVDLAATLDVPVAWLLDPSPPGIVRPLAALTHRPRGGLTAAAAAALMARAAEWLERYCAAEAAIGLVPGAGPLTHSCKVECLSAAEGAAEQVRAEWSLGSDAIESVVDTLEDHGVPVMLIREASPLDAQAVVADSGRVAVLVSAQPWDRQRFSLAHELAHLVLRPSAGVDPEQAAHRFAAAFLVPAGTARRELGARRRSLDVDELRSLKRKYGLSVQAWVRRARELEIISRREAAAEIERMRKLGWEAAGPAEGVRSEVPLRLERLVLRALAEGAITESRGAELLAQPVGLLRDRLRCA